MRRRLILRKRRRVGDIWPILESAGETPDDWPGWPDAKKFALVLTHDVDTARGQDRCWELMDIEMAAGFRSSFNFVPERYEVSSDLRQQLLHNGFEVGVHGLNHDGKLYSSRKIFSERAAKINVYLQQWKAVGFRSPAMHHNLEWIQELDIEYDASTFDTDPFEPQPDAVATIFPLWVQNGNRSNGYVELPYTLPQDFTLFVLMKEIGIDIWRKKTAWVADKGGMVLLNTHPDYMSMRHADASIETYPASYYLDFLNFIQHDFKDKYWHVLPRELARFWTGQRKSCPAS